MQDALRARTTKPVILIVEDEVLLRLDAADLLEEAGYKVLQAQTADEALALLERRDDVAVIFTDIQLPGSMDGLRLASAVRDRWPPIRIIATSGRLEVLPSELPEGGRFIAKPYTGDQVTAVIEEFMSA